MIMLYIIATTMKKKTEKKIDRIIKSLLVNDVQDRLTITECLSTYFNN